MEALLEQLKSMRTGIEDTVAVGILVASIEVTALLSVTEAIKTLAESDITWESVSERLLEEHMVRIRRPSRNLKNVRRLLQKVVESATGLTTRRRIVG